MSDNDKYDITDLISSALDQQPVEFEKAFDSLVVDRIRTAIEDKKIAIAKQMYGYTEPEEGEEEPEEE